MVETDPLLPTTTATRPRRRASSASPSRRHIVLRTASGRVATPRSYAHRLVLGGLLLLLALLLALRTLDAQTATQTATQPVAAGVRTAQTGDSRFWRQRRRLVRRPPAPGLPTRGGSKTKCTVHISGLKNKTLTEVLKWIKDTFY
ncbi:hypothetical protein BDR26DRAFT_933425 [Obelidium mucronatum]|nr:hypothetical protein BDR26DRAFT_933425 [Obelidium mucronatum]